MKYYLTIEEDAEIIRLYFDEKIQQKKLAEMYNIRLHYVQTVCQNYMKNRLQSLKEKTFLKPKPVLYDFSYVEPTPIHTIADCKTNPELLTKDYYHTITVMSGV